jgi:hypothetical protein
MWFTQSAVWNGVAVGKQNCTVFVLLVFVAPGGETATQSALAV